MPRIARVVAPGFPHHVVQRGNNRDNIFFSKRDRQKYLSLLAHYSGKWDCRILAYCLMSNHVHLLARPGGTESLHKMMQGITLCYTQYINRSRSRTGRLWESRYHSCVIDNERYLWTVARYIEQNPIRARMVKRAEDYPYSSAAAHINGTGDGVLTGELFGEEQRKEYARFLNVDTPVGESREIRYHTKTGRPMGDESFLRALERRSRRTLAPKPRGRPRKRGQR